MMCNDGEQAGCTIDTANVLYDGKESRLVLTVKPKSEISVTSSGCASYLLELNTNFSSSERNDCALRACLQLHAETCVRNGTVRPLLSGHDPIVGPKFPSGIFFKCV
jgi:hypothetical protein